MPRIAVLIVRYARAAVVADTRRMNKGGGFMKILKGVTLVTTVVLALAAQGSAATSHYSVGVLTVPGVNTGLVLKKGQTVTVTATGTVCYFPTGPLCVSPEGDLGVNTSTGFVLPGATGIALIGRVGSGPWVEIGSGPMPLSGKGELVFAVNDIYFPDNTGSFEVTVTYEASGASRTCWPGWGYGDLNHQHCGPPGQEKKTEQSSQPAQEPSHEHGQPNEKGSAKK